MVDQNKADTDSFLQPKIIMFSAIKTLPDPWNKCFLQELYVEKGLSTTQIAVQSFSSKATIANALRYHQIPIRPKGSGNKLHTLPYGKRSVGGKVVLHKGEHKIIKKIIKMHQDGISNNAITKKLNELKVPTKNGASKWHYENIRLILIREGLYKPKHKKFGDN